MESTQVVPGAAAPVADGVLAVLVDAVAEIRPLLGLFGQVSG